ncbi:MAG TPA: VWA domain-containing protein [Silvibacterium sp.]|nr:VWA domain-containing protein [Silvibacterium sp.]
MRRILPLFAALLLPAFAAAQPANSTPTIQVTSRIVYVDVIVRDSAGQIVHGLKQNDFHVLEDGKPQQIDYFAEHVYNPAARVAKAVSVLDFSNTNTPGQADAITILLLDLLNTSTSNQVVARKQMLKFLSALPPGRRILLFTLTDKLQMIQSFTGSPELLADAAKMLKPVSAGQMPQREEVQQEQNAAAEFNRESSPRGHSPSGATAMDDNVQTQDSDAGLRTYSTIAALTQLAHIMSGYEGRKNVFWVSESFPIALNTTIGGWGQTLSVDAKKMTNFLANARIAVYPVSVLGLDLGPSLAAFGGTSANLPEFKVPFFARGNLKTTMNTIADQTGGQAIVGTNDFAGEMRRNLDDGSNYYTLAYQPQSKKWNKQFRSIRVELTKTGNSLAYRRGYFAYPDSPSIQNPAQELRAALQPDTPEFTMLALQSKVEPPNAQHSGVLVHSVLNGASLNLIPSADDHRRGQLIVTLVAFSDSPAKPKPQPESPPQTSGVLNLDLDPAQYQTILKDGIAFTQQLQLPPGRYRLRLGVTDTATCRLGTLDMAIAVPAQVANR